MAHSNSVIVALQVISFSNPSASCKDNADTTDDRNTISAK